MNLQWYFSARSLNTKTYIGKWFFCCDGSVIDLQGKYFHFKMLDNSCKCNEFSGMISSCHNGCYTWKNLHFSMAKNTEERCYIATPHREWSYVNKKFSRRTKQQLNNQHSAFGHDSIKITAFGLRNLKPTGHWWSQTKSGNPSAITIHR